MLIRSVSRIPIVFIVSALVITLSGAQIKMFKQSGMHTHISASNFRNSEFSVTNDWIPKFFGTPNGTFPKAEGGSFRSTRPTWTSIRVPHEDDEFLGLTGRSGSNLNRGLDDWFNHMSLQKAAMSVAGNPIGSSINSGISTLNLTPDFEKFSGEAISSQGESAKGAINFESSTRKVWDAMEFQSSMSQGYGFAPGKVVDGQPSEYLSSWVRVAYTDAPRGRGGEGSSYIPVSNDTLSRVDPNEALARKSLVFQEDDIRNDVTPSLGSIYRSEDAPLDLGFLLNTNQVNVMFSNLGWVSPSTAPPSRGIGANSFAVSEPAPLYVLSFFGLVCYCTRKGR